MILTIADRIDENLKNSLQVDLDKMAPGLHVQVWGSGLEGGQSSVLCINVLGCESHQA